VKTIISPSCPAPDAPRLDSPPRPAPDAANLDSDVSEIGQRNVGNTVRASWNFSLDDIRSNIARYNPDAKTALIKAFLWCIDPLHPLSKPQFAKEVGSSDNTIYKLYTGKYKSPTGAPMGPSDDLVKSVWKFLAREREIFVTGERDFVLTPTAQKIVTACQLARESKTPVFVVGPSHIGKTWTLERYYTPNNNHGTTVYSRMRAASGLGGMVRRIADDVGVSDKSNTADLIERIKGALAPNMLLILDELHLLAHTYRKGSFHNCMEVIREIYDEVGCGMILSFTILDEVKAASQKELQQLWRRGTHKVWLPVMPTKQDVAMILKHNGLDFPAPNFKVEIPQRDTDGKTFYITESPYAILKQVGREEALKAITERIRYAHKLAVSDKKKIAWEHFVRAHLLIAKEAEQDGEWDAVKV